MRKYLSILRLGWLDAIEYRTDFFVSVVSWGIRLFIALFLWLAVAEARGGEIGPYTLQSIVVYFFIVQIIGSFVFSRVGFEIAYDIYRGDFVNHLLKPMNYLVFRLVHEISKNVFRTLLGLLIFGSLLFAFFGGITLPLWKLPLALLALTGAYLVNFFLVAMIALLAFWVTNATRFTFIYFGCLTIFSGMMIPLDLFPEHFAVIFLRLPFSSIFFFPAKIIQSKTIQPTFLEGFLIQGFYILTLGLLLALMYRAGVRKFEAVGR